MSRAKARPRLPPQGAGSFGGFGAPPVSAKGTGFGGLTSTQNKSGLSYLTERQDFASISDANVAVQFKNLLKRDSKTKARALEELLAFAQKTQNTAVEDGVLEAWVPLFPRLSMDSDRKVRELAHTLQFALLQAGKKRMERHIPQVVGPWLAGVYDRDRAVARAASESVAALLNTDDKRRLFWKKCKRPILAYATAAMQETPATLSDMRTTAAEDAALIFYRVLYGTLSLVLALLQTLEPADMDELADSLTRFFAVDNVVASAASPDGSVRRAAYDIFRAVLQTRPDLLLPQIGRLSDLLTHEALKMSQAGSVGALVQLLTFLSKAQAKGNAGTTEATETAGTAATPTFTVQLWGRGGKSNAQTHPLTQLRPLLEKGSQGDTSPAFWQGLDDLLSAVYAVCPETITPKEASNILVSFRNGLSSRDETRTNALSGWTAYLSLAKYLLAAMQEGRVDLAESHVLPLFGHYVSPAKNVKSAWNTGAQLPIITSAALLCGRPVHDDVVASSRAEWARLSAALAERMSNSLPEVSKEHARSQQEIASEGDRWFALVHDVHRTVASAASSSTGPANLVEDVLRQPTLELLRSAVDLLQRRNYKPFGAAHVLSAAFSHAPHLFSQGDDDGRHVAESLFPVDSRENLSLLLASASATQLLSCLRSMASMSGYLELYERTFSAITVLLLEGSTNDAESTAKNITLLLTDTSEYAASTSRGNAALQSCLLTLCFDIVCARLASWDLFHAAFASNAFAPATGQALTKQVIQVLGTADADADRALAALEIIAQSNPEFLPTGEAHHVDLVTRLLAVTEINDGALSSRVASLRENLGSHAVQGELPLVKIIRENLETAALESLEIDTLAEQAAAILVDGKKELKRESLLPSTTVWMQEMLTFLQGRDLSPSLSLTSSLGGAYLLIHGFPKQAKEEPIRRDQHGHSVPARMSAYTMKLLEAESESGSGSERISSLPQALAVDLLYMLYLVAEVGADQIVLEDPASIWGDLSDSYAVSVAEDAVAAIQSLLAKTVISLSSSAGNGEQICHALCETMLSQTTNISPLSLYTARALCQLLQTRVDSRGFTSAEQDWVAGLNVWKTATASSAPSSVLGAVAVLTGYGELLTSSKVVSNFCNRLISDAAGAKVDEKHEDAALGTLVLLNACLAVYDGADQLPVATNRIVFAVRQITSWFGEGEEEDDNDEKDEKDGEGRETHNLSPRLAAESCRVLQKLLPAIKDIYGPHWERCIHFCLGLWTRKDQDAQLDLRLPYVHASLKLMTALETVEEPNDDLEEALQSCAAKKWQGILRLLLRTAEEEGEEQGSREQRSGSQAQEIVDGLLCRLASKMPFEYIEKQQKEHEERIRQLYRLIGSNPPLSPLASSRTLQTAAFHILHQAIPAVQEELSFQVILEKKQARLPDELLSLLQEAPILESVYIEDEDLAEEGEGARDGRGQSLTFTFSTAVRSYLLAWMLIFDAFSTASAKVRGDYAEQMGQGGYLNGLLTFTFDVLGHSAAHALPLDKAGLDGPERIADYDIAVAEAEAAADETEKGAERSLQWLLVHLYYGSLKYLPGSVRGWFAACRSKQTTMAASAWTARYFSATLTSDVLDEVVAWAANQEESAGGSDGIDEKTLQIKVNKTAREVVASYEVDDTEAAMVVRLPETYPLDNVVVEGVRRVAASPKKWQSWMMIVQGVITFSNGNVVDGLQAFRRNIVGALKGQTECAICYSIVSEDKRMPDKRCSTCKNLFHRFCLFRWMESSHNNTCPLCRTRITLNSDRDRERRRG